jgi:sugar/nucleoside kinase (ribokinase family)
VITLGADGAFYHHRDGTRFLVPAYNIDVVCTCGCGDVFNAGFAVGVLNGMSPQESVRLASAASALNATGLGSQAGIVSLEETLAFMRQRPVRASGPLTLSA